MNLIGDRCNWWSEVKHDFGNVMASSPQFWGWLENRGGKDDEILKRVWKAAETKAKKTRVAEIKEEREKIKRQ